MVGASLDGPWANAGVSHNAHPTQTVQADRAALIGGASNWLDRNLDPIRCVGVRSGAFGV